MHFFFIDNFMRIFGIYMVQNYVVEHFLANLVKVCVQIIFVE